MTAVLRPCKQGFSRISCAIGPRSHCRVGFPDVVWLLSEHIVTINTRSALAALLMLTSAVAAFAQAKPPAASSQAKMPPAISATDTAEARERNLSAYVELLRADVRAQKVAIIT